MAKRVIISHIKGQLIAYMHIKHMFDCIRACSSQQHANSVQLMGPKTAPVPRLLDRYSDQACMLEWEAKTNTDLIKTGVTWQQ